MAETITCNACGVAKPPHEMVRRKHRPTVDGKKVKAPKDAPWVYTKLCKDCSQEQVSKWCRENPDRVKARTAAWRKANSASHKSLQRGWRERNAEWLRAYGQAYHRERYADPVVREAKREIVRAWKKANPERVKTLNTRRAQRLAGSYVEDVDALVVLEHDDGVCGICGEDVDPLDFHVDHKLALADGGWHAYDNVQVAHPSCNCSKQAT